MIQDAATASSSIIDETMAMLNEQDTLDNVKAKLKPFNVDERIQNLPKVVRKLCKVCGPGHISIVRCERTNASFHNFATQIGSATLLCSCTDRDRMMCALTISPLLNFCLTSAIHPTQSVW